MEEFSLFCTEIIESLTEDSKMFIYGSSVSGVKFRLGGEFDESSDIDVGIVSEELFQCAKKKKVKIYNNSNTIAFNFFSREAKVMNLSQALKKAYKAMSSPRKITFSIYECWGDIDVYPVLKIH